MGSLFSLTGHAQLLKKLAVMGTAVTATEKKAVESTADAMEQTMHQLVSKDTGELDSKIGQKEISTSAMESITRIGPSDDMRESRQGKPYSVFVEYGTSKMAARPYVRPAYEVNKDKLLNYLKSGILKLG